QGSCASASCETKLQFSRSYGRLPAPRSSPQLAGFSYGKAAFTPPLDAVPKERTLAPRCNLITQAVFGSTSAQPAARLCHFTKEESCSAPASAARISVI